MNTEYAVIAHDDPRFALAREVRRVVFVEEQRVPESEEYDGLDETSGHILCQADGEALGTLRFYGDDGWLHIGRVAVLARARGLGLGLGMMERCLAEGRRLGFARTFLNAQTDKRGFYRKLGFRDVGGEFMEAGIPHFRMEAEL